MPFRDVAEKQGAIGTLVYLYENREKKINVSELVNNRIANREAILTTIKLLKINGLVDDETCAKFPFEHLLWLTPLGVDVSKQFYLAAKVFRDQEHQKEASNGKLSNGHQPNL